jgi:hypothetical protein
MPHDSQDPCPMITDHTSSGHGARQDEPSGAPARSRRAGAESRGATRAAAAPSRLIGRSALVAIVRAGVLASGSSRSGSPLTFANSRAIAKTGGRPSTSFPRR